VFIEAARRYYALDIAPRFWEVLLEKAKAGLLLSIDRVKDELDRSKDELMKWLKRHFRRYIRKTSESNTIESYRQLMQWIQHQEQYRANAKQDFVREDNADAWVIAFAMAHSCIVVTQEISDPQSKRRIKIPDVCKAWEITCINTFDMMRRLDIKL
jgi:hypothetical protein